MRGSGITHDLVNPRTNGMPLTSSTAADKLLPQRGGSLAHILQKFFFLQLLPQRGGSLAYILKEFVLSFYRDCAWEICYASDVSGCLPGDKVFWEYVF